MNWIATHQDAVYAIVMATIATLSYLIGKEAGFSKGLDAGYASGYKTGKNHASR